MSEQTTQAEPHTNGIIVARLHSLPEQKELKPTGRDGKTADAVTLILDANIMGDLSTPRNNEKTWLDLLPLIADLPTVKQIIIPAYIADVELCGQVSVEKGRGERKIAPIDRRFHSGRPDKSFSIHKHKHDHTNPLFEIASRLQLNKTGESKFIPGKIPNIIVWETKEGNEKAADILAAYRSGSTHREADEAVNKIRNGSDHGELDMANIAMRNQNVGNAFLITNDNRFIDKTFPGGTKKIEPDRSLAYSNMRGFMDAVLKAWGDQLPQALLTRFKGDESYRFEEGHTITQISDKIIAQMERFNPSDRGYPSLSISASPVKTADGRSVTLTQLLTEGVEMQREREHKTGGLPEQESAVAPDIIKPGHLENIIFSTAIDTGGLENLSPSIMAAASPLFSHITATTDADLPAIPGSPAPAVAAAALGTGAAAMSLHKPDPVILPDKEPATREESTMEHAKGDTMSTNGTPTHSEKAPSYAEIQARNEELIDKIRMLNGGIQEYSGKVIIWHESLPDDYKEVKLKNPRDANKELEEIFEKIATFELDKGNEAVNNEVLDLLNPGKQPINRIVLPILEPTQFETAETILDRQRSQLIEEITKLVDYDAKTGKAGEVETGRMGIRIKNPYSNKSITIDPEDKDAIAQLERVRNQIIAQKEAYKAKKTPSAPDMVILKPSAAPAARIAPPRRPEPPAPVDAGVAPADAGAVPVPVLPELPTAVAAPVIINAAPTVPDEAPAPAVRTERPAPVDKPAVTGAARGDVEVSPRDIQEPQKQIIPRKEPTMVMTPAEIESFGISEARARKLTLGLELRSQRENAKIARQALAEAIQERYNAAAAALEAAHAQAIDVRQVARWERGSELPSQEIYNAIREIIVDENGNLNEAQKRQFGDALDAAYAISKKEFELPGEVRDRSKQEALADVLVDIETITKVRFDREDISQKIQRKLIEKSALDIEEPRELIMNGKRLGQYQALVETGDIIPSPGYLAAVLDIIAAPDELRAKIQMLLGASVDEPVVKNAPAKKQELSETPSEQNPWAEMHALQIKSRSYFKDADNNLMSAKRISALTDGQVKEGRLKQLFHNKKPEHFFITGEHVREMTPILVDAYIMNETNNNRKPDAQAIQADLLKLADMIDTAKSKIAKKSEIKPAVEQAEKELPEKPAGFAAKETARREKKADAHSRIPTEPRRPADFAESSLTPVKIAQEAVLKLFAVNENDLPSGKKIADLSEGKLSEDRVIARLTRTSAVPFIKDETFDAFKQGLEVALKNHLREQHITNLNIVELNFGKLATRLDTLRTALAESKAAER